MSAQATASDDPADVSGLLHSATGPVHPEVLHRSVSVLQLHAGELRLPACGETGFLCAAFDLKLVPYTSYRASVLCRQHGWSLAIDLIIGAQGIHQRTENSTVSEMLLLNPHKNTLNVKNGDLTHAVLLVAAQMFGQVLPGVQHLLYRGR